MSIPELYVKADCTIGETPFWDAGTGKLYFIDILGNSILVFDDKTEELKKISVGQNIGSIVLAENGNIVANLTDGIYFVNEERGEIKFIVNPEADVENNRFNDGKCDPSGRLWVGTMSRTLDSGFGDYIPRGALYCMGLDMRIEKKLDGVTISNGLAWTSDKSVLYFIDSPTKKVVAFDYDDATANISNKRTALDFENFGGVPDGMCIDSEDRLWIAFFDGAAIRYCDPHDGKILESIEIPATKATCVAFGGHDYRDLFVTTGSIDTDMGKYPDAGSVFKLRVDTPGLPPVKYKGRG